MRDTPSTKPKHPWFSTSTLDEIAYKDRQATSFVKQSNEYYHPRCHGMNHFREPTVVA